MVRSSDMYHQQGKFTNDALHTASRVGGRE